MFLKCCCNCIIVELEVYANPWCFMFAINHNIGRSIFSSLTSKIHKDFKIWWLTNRKPWQRMPGRFKHRRMFVKTTSIQSSLDSLRFRFVKKNWHFFHVLQESQSCFTHLRLQNTTSRSLRLVSFSDICVWYYAARQGQCWKLLCYGDLKLLRLNLTFARSDQRKCRQITGSVFTINASWFSINPVA